MGRIIRIAVNCKYWASDFKKYPWLFEFDHTKQLSYCPRSWLKLIAKMIVMPTWLIIIKCQSLETNIGKENKNRNIIPHIIICTRLVCEEIKEILLKLLRYFLHSVFYRIECHIHIFSSMGQREKHIMPRMKINSLTQ